MPAVVFAAVLATLYAAHAVGDHWATSHRGAQRKGLRRADVDRLNAVAGSRQLHHHAGPRACAAHVASYTITGLVFLAVAAWRLHLGLDVDRVAAGMLVTAVTHYWADRRYTLAWLCRKLGKSQFYQLGAPRPGHDDNPTLGTGSYALDQSFHVLFLFVTALIIA